MKRFKTTVTRTDEYVIEIDENIINQEWMENYKKYFADFDTYEEHAEHLAQMRARFEHGFIEGYGTVLVDGRKPWYIQDDNKVDKGINIKILSEDQDCEVDVEEIE